MSAISISFTFYKSGEIPLPRKESAASKSDECKRFGQLVVIPIIDAFIAGAISASNNARPISFSLKSCPATPMASY
jgi:hypothetical protein